MGQGGATIKGVSLLYLVYDDDHHDHNNDENDDETDFDWNYIAQSFQLVRQIMQIYCLIWKGETN